ncbi:Aspartate aminotransferase [compost metagenome]
MVHSIGALGFVNASVFMQRIIGQLQDIRIDPEPYKIRRDLMVSTLQESGYSITQIPDGGIFIFPESPIQDDHVFCDYLAQQHHIFTVPGSAFGRPGYFRLSFSNEMEKIIQAKEGLQEAYRHFK